jgi:hypothetical protein
VARRPTRGQLIAALEVILEALREGAPVQDAPLVAPTDSRAGRACPVHLRELVLGTPRGGRARYVCPVSGCRAADTEAA